MKKTAKAFTLIEILIAITIFSIIIVTVISIFIISSILNTKIELSRNMQENVKNMVEIMSEDVRVGRISVCNGTTNVTDCHTIDSGKYSVSNELIVIVDDGAGGDYKRKYTLMKYNDTIADYIPTNGSGCDIYNPCEFRVVDLRDGSNYRVSNSWVQFGKLDVYVSNEYEPKASLSFEIMPAIKKGVKETMIENFRFDFQTTISERLYKDY